MPETKPAPQIQDVDLEQEALITSLQQMKDAYALSLVRQTFWHYETYRQQNHDPRWNINDALYLGWRQQEVWEGTTTPRSSLSYPIVFDQIEASLPAITQALFGSQPDWFQVEADFGGDPQAARAVQAHLLYLLDHDKDDYGLTAKNDLEMAIKCLLMYGNGGVAIEWDSRKQRPQVSWVDNRDIYFDPATPMPQVDASRSVIRRTKRTVEEVKSWASIPGMSIPEDAILWNFAKNPQWSTSEQTKQIQAALLGVNANQAQVDSIPNPADQFIEVLTYYSQSRIIVVLNREWVAFVEKNPYGFIPFCFAPCYTVPGRFYSLSLPDVQEGNQRTIEALLNGRLDNIALALRPPRVQASGSNMTPAQQKWRPGAVFKVAKPKEDLLALNPDNITTSVYEEIDYIERLAEKRTGINALGQGVPRPSNANRTASGMQMQLQGSANRLQMLVKHIEDYLLIPMLYKMHKMIRVHSQPDKPLRGRTTKGELVAVNAQAFDQPINFKILASSQMVTRDRLSQIFPTLIQFLAQGPLVQGLQASGLAIDWTELFQLMQDATGVGRLYKLVRPMNDQEKQAAQQPPPQVQAELQMAREKNQTELQKEQIKQQGDQNPAELQAEQQKLEMEMMKEQMKLQIEQQKMELEKEKAQMQLQIKRLEMQMKAQELQMKQAFEQAGMQQDFQLKSQQAQLDSQLSQQQHALSMKQNQEQADLQSQQTQAQHEQALKQTKESGDMKRQELKTTAATKAKLSARGKPVKTRPQNR